MTPSYNQLYPDVEKYLAPVLQQDDVDNKLTHVVSLHDFDHELSNNFARLISSIASIQLVDIGFTSESKSTAIAGGFNTSFYNIDALNVENIKSVLLKSNITEEHHVLFVAVISKCNQDKIRAMLGAIKPLLGKSDLILLSESVMPDATLFDIAESGLFNKLSKTVSDSSNGWNINWLESRDYIIRMPRQNDLAQLVALDEACWNDARRSSVSDIRKRVSSYPQGQCVLEVDNTIVGSIYSQRINDLKALEGQVNTNIIALHQPDAKIAQLIAVNIHPQKQHLGYGDQLLEFMLQYCTANNDIDSAAAISLCKNYPLHNTMSMSAYIKERDSDGFLLDPILRFHEYHGALITKLMPGYRPADTDNQGNGVLVEYELSNRKVFRAAESSHLDSNDPPLISNGSISIVVEELVISILGVHRSKNFSVEKSLMDMGFDSLDLMKLKAQLSARLATELDSTFFFENSNVDSITHALKEKSRKKAKSEQNTEPTKKWSRSDSSKHVDNPSSLSQSNGVANEAIAIIGIGCRYPGDVDSAESLWSMLEKAEDGIGSIPLSRWDTALYNKEESSNHINSTEGGILNNIDQFAAAFFGISPREANLLDPQQRILLEVSYQAMEHAGVSSSAYKGKDVGIFTGMFSHDYELLQIKNNAPDQYEPYYATGNSNAVAAGRLAYVFGFQGPAITVDTACSSSLVATHLACQSLRQDECEIALAGGVNLILSPELSFAFSKAGMLSVDGRCKTFDKQANGYVRSEGCGIVVLKKLSRAIEDNDNVIAVIRGSAVNQDGASNGLTAPNPLAQETVIRKALAQAKIKPTDVSYIEAHGTGTNLGDPIEVSALENVYGENREKDNVLSIGSIKTNIGHTEAAAGIAGLIKSALSLQHQYIPAHLHYQESNPSLQLNAIPATIPAVGRQWELFAEQSKRFAGVSSFGFSGTNAHIILEQSPVSNIKKPLKEKDFFLLPLSAKTTEACDSLITEYVEYLASDKHERLSDISYTASVGRNHFSERACIIASNSKDAVQKITALKNKQLSADVLIKNTQDNNQKKIVFLFTGQGSQLVAMGRTLYETNNVFRESLDECEALLKPHLDKLLLDVIFDDDVLLHQTQYTQPALFSIEYSLARLWISWGVTPDVVMGHSVGEYVAACIAGVFSLQDACRLIAKRGQLMQSLPTGGAMAAIFASEQNVTKKIRHAALDISIAAINGPEHTVVSGNQQAVDVLCAEFEENDIQVYRLQVSHAFHSELMQPILNEFEAFAATIKFNTPTINCISNLSGQLAKDEMLDAHYWVQHITSPVQFYSSMKTLEQLDIGFYLEVGPQPILIGMGKRCLPTSSSKWLSSLENGVSNWRSMFRSLAAFYIAGADINWSDVYNKNNANKVTLPSYPFERSHYWFEESTGNLKNTAWIHSDNKIHPLLGCRLALPSKEKQYQSTISLSQLAYLADHCVFEQALFPAAAFIEVALAAANDIHSDCGWTVSNSHFKQALSLMENVEQNLHVVIRTDGHSHAFSIYSYQSSEFDHDQWILHCDGVLLKQPAVNSSLFDIADIRARFEVETNTEQFYSELEVRQYQYGSSFQAIEQLFRNKKEVLAKIQLPQDISHNNYFLHPVILDACFQSALHLTTENTLVPISVDELNFSSVKDNILWAYTELVEVEENNELCVNITLTELSGNIAAEIKGLRFMATQREVLLSTNNTFLEQSLYNINWEDKALVLKDDSSSLVVTPAVIDAHLVSVEKLDNQLLQLDLSEKILCELESLCIAYVVTALEHLGQSMAIGEKFTSADIALGYKSAQRSDITAHHYQQLEHLLAMLVDKKILSKQKGVWTVITLCDKPSVEQKYASILKQYPIAEPELVFINRCGSQLADALQNKCDVLQLLFPEGDTEGAARFYQQSLTFKGMNRLVAESVVKIAHDFPLDKPIRILEIGAGTGGITSHILPCLKNRKVEYVFTDVSRLFLSKASEQFDEFNFVKYSLLDIESSPLEQGFSDAEFDVIVAANVLHATEDLSVTLGNAKKLLADNGMLVLLEGTAASNWIDLIFGLTEGWWRFTDKALRPSHPLLSDNTWIEFLTNIGFDSCVTHCPDKHGNKMLFKQSIVIAKNKIEQSVVEQVNNIPWLIFVDNTGIANKLATRLTDAGEAVILVTAGNEYKSKSDSEFVIQADSYNDYAMLLKEVCKSNTLLRGVIYCWGLELDNIEKVLSSGVKGFSNAGYGSILNIIKVLVDADLKESPQLSIVTQNAQAINDIELLTGIAQSHLWGMGKVLTLEHPELKCKLIDIDNDSAENIDVLYNEVANGLDEHQVVLRNNKRYVARLKHYHADDVQVAEKNDSSRKNKKLEIDERGTLDQLNLHTIEQLAPAENEIQIRINAASLNFRDVLNALGHYPGDPGPLGDECAGEVIALGHNVNNFSIGDRVMSMAAGSLAEYVNVDSQLAVKIPNKINDQQASSIPVVFLTVHYALRILAGIKRGDRVLIHAATGGVGQSAIQIAQQVGAEIFATASPAKWDVLRDMGVQHIMNSRDLDFAEQIKSLTRGEGVDIVLNSLAGEFIEKSLAILKPQGCFLEIGKSGIWKEEKVTSLYPLMQYHIIDMLEVRRTQAQLVQTMLTDLAAEFNSGDLQPLPYKEFSLENSVEAFRYMQHARHTGKIVISMTHSEILSDNMNSFITPVVRDDATYLITGGLGGLGLLLADWFIEKGAKRLVLISRSIGSDDAQLKVNAMREQGIDIVVEQADVCDGNSINEIIKKQQQHTYPLHGVIHAVGVLDDGALIQQTAERFKYVMAPKIEGAWNLHQATQNINLDFFILFSSTASLLGTPGQANHAAANAFMDQLSYYRRSRGLTSSCINWGAWSDVGAAARYDVGAQWAQRGISSITPQQGIDAFNFIFSHCPAQVGVAPIHWDKYLQYLSDDKVQPFYAYMDVAAEEIIDINMKTEVVSIVPADVKQDVQDGDQSSLVNYLREQVARVLHFDSNMVLDSDQLLNEYGLDSLTGIELRNRINKDLGTRLSLEQFFNKASLTRWSISIGEQIMLDKLESLSEIADVAESEDFEEMTV